MGAIATLFLVLAGLYLLECVLWMRWGTVVFHRPLGRRWRILSPGGVVSTTSGGLGFLNPLPYFGTTLRSEQWMISPSPDGVASQAAPCLLATSRWKHRGRFVRWTQIEHIEVHGSAISINGKRFVRLHCEEKARWLAALLSELRELPQEARERRIVGAIEHGMRWTDHLESGESLEEDLQWLRSFSAGLFLVLFVALPLLISWRGIGPRLWPVVGLGLSFWLAAVINASLLERRRHAASWSGLLSHVIPLVLFPPAAIRAVDRLGLEAFPQADPLALGLVLLREESQRRFVTAVLLDLHHPLPFASEDHAAQIHEDPEVRSPIGSEDDLAVEPENAPADDPKVVSEDDRGDVRDDGFEDDPAAVTGSGLAEAVEWFRQRLLNRAERSVRQAGLDPDELLSPPPRIQDDEQSYCPRCRATFIRIGARCRACGNMETVEFDGGCAGDVAQDRHER